MVHGAQHALGRAKRIAGDDLRVTVKRVETPFISIHSKTVKELLAGGVAGREQKRIACLSRLLECIKCE